MTDRDEELAREALGQLSMGVNSILGSTTERPQEIIGRYIRQARREGELAMLTKVEERLKDLTTDAGGQPIYIGTQWKAVGLQDAIRYHLFQLRRAPDQESQG